MNYIAMQEEEKQQKPKYPGKYWCHIRKDYFPWEEAMAFWKAHNWDGTPKK